MLYIYDDSVSIALYVHVSYMYMIYTYVIFMLLYIIQAIFLSHSLVWELIYDCTDEVSRMITMHADLWCLKIKIYDIIDIYWQRNKNDQWSYVNWVM